MYRVQAINAFNDNYIWAIIDDQKDCCALVDPGCGQASIEFLSNEKLNPTAILITHKHADHIGGIKAVSQYAQNTFSQLPVVYGPKGESTGTDHIKLKQNDKVALTNPAITFTVIDLPGHTLGHIAYVNDDLVFCGDTLFSGGCGRIFEGTPAQMFASLNKLKELAEHTKVYCAHEYTSANLAFALSVDSNNDDLVRYAQTVKEKRAKDVATIPSTIGLEKQINPFLRADNSQLTEQLETQTGKQFDSPLTVFTELRALKDNF